MKEDVVTNFECRSYQLKIHMRFQVNCPSSSRHILYLKNKFYNFKNWERERYIKFWSNPLNFINKIFLLLDYSIFFLVKERKVMSLDIFQRIDFTILCVVKGVFFYFFLFMTAVFVNTTGARRTGARCSFNKIKHDSHVVFANRIFQK